MRSSRSRLAFLFGLMLTAAASHSQIAVSTFDTDADGWMMANVNSTSFGNPPGIINTFNPNFSANTGNPGGEIWSPDGAAGPITCFVAPAKFLGDKLGAYGGTLTFDMALLGDISKKLGSCDNPDFEIIWGEGGWWPFTNVCNDEKTCMWTDFRSRPPRIHICQKKALKPNCGPLLCQLIHELIHAIGIIHTGDSTAFDCVNKLAGCEDFKPYTSRTAKGGASRTDQSQSK